VPSTVLIASPEHLPALKAQDDFGDALTFSDAEALRALEVITRERPDVVALEKLFASTSRGTALINRIKADPALTGCEIRIVTHDDTYSRGTPRVGAASAAAAAPVAVAEPKAPSPTPTLSPLDYRGTRRAPRFRVVEAVEVLIDGNAAALVDVSVLGAMVTSATILRPNQRVRLTLPDSTRPIRFSGGIAWAAFELLKGGPRYRAGVEFFDADPAAVQRFIDANKRA
jgi:hypothetical protein